MKSEPRAYYLSNNAYDRLVGMAQKRQYVKWGTNKAKGLSSFLNDLAQIELEDTRPASVRERHEQEMKYNRAPTWLQIRIRRARLLTLTEDALARYWKVAFEVGICKAGGYAVGGPTMRSPVPSVAYVIEAIALGWLTPVEWPKGNLEQ